MNLIDLFSGAGGLTEGFRNKEFFDIVCHIEMNRDASSTLQLRDAFYDLKNKKEENKYFEFLKNNKSISELYESVNESILKKSINQKIDEETINMIFKKIKSMMKQENIKNIDGIIGGPPCQAYSTVGRARNKYKKDKDDRIYLYKYYIEFLKEFSPKFFLFENVKGLLSFKDYNGMPLLKQMMGEFHEAGYELDYKIINAAEYGVPQNRERLIIFGTDGSTSPKTFFDLLLSEKKDGVNLRDLFRDLPNMKSNEEKNVYSDRKPSTFVKKYIRTSKLVPLTYQISRFNNENDLNIYKIVVANRMRGNSLKYNELPSRFQTHKNKNTFLDRYKALSYDDVSHTLVAHIAKDGHYYIHPDIKQNRSITVREAARIQTFPDDFYFLNSRSAAFTQIGNAVPPMLSKCFANVIKNMY